MVLHTQCFDEPHNKYYLYEQFQDSFVVGVHIIFFVTIGLTLCTVWNADRQAGLSLEMVL